MKNTITNCPDGTKGIFKKLSGGLKALMILLLFMGAAQFKVTAQTPACNIQGPLEGCGLADNTDTRNDMTFNITFAQSGVGGSDFGVSGNGVNPTINYSFVNNSIGAFVRSVDPPVHTPALNRTTQTIYVFPGTGNGGWELKVDITNNFSGLSNSCSPSVTIFYLTVEADHTLITCPGGTSTLTAVGNASPAFPITYTLFPGGATNSTGIFGSLSGSVGGTAYTVEAATAFCIAETQETIFAPAESPIVLDCPENANEDACQTQEAINEKFQAWLESFNFDGGTNGVAKFSPEVPEAPGICGGTTEVTYTVTDDCGQEESCTKSFTVSQPTALDAICPGDVELDACSTSEAITEAYNAWKAGFSVSGGCRPTDNLEDFPALGDLLCGGEISFTLIANNAEGTCPGTDQCTSTFSVGTPTPVDAICPGDVELDACSTADAVTAAYNTWKAGFSVTGGCNPTDNLEDFPSLGDLLCGGEISFTLIAQNAQGTCPGRDECTSTFSVGTPTPVDAICPGDVDLDACSTSEAITAAYNAWKAGFSVTGGCNPTDNLEDFPALGDLLCGGEISFTLIANNAEGTCPGTDQCTSTFSVGSLTPLNAICPGDVEVDACSTSEAITAAYNAWKAGFSVTGGCDPTDNLEDFPALGDLLCGGEISFTLIADNAQGACPGHDECTSTFSVGTPTPVDAICPGDVTLDACSTSEAITEAYNEWKAGFSVSGGCNPTDNLDDFPGLPEDIACGGEISFTLIAQNGQGLCAGRDECTSTFKVNTGEGVQISLSCEDDKEIGCTDEVSFDEPTPSGGCGTVNVTVKGEDQTVTNPDGTTSYIRTWEAVDACGNKAECSQKVTKTCCASLGDFVWEDKNNDGIQDAGEPGVQNVTVTLYMCGSNTEVATTSTNSSGNYLFENLCAGRYYVKFSGLPSGYNFSTKDAGGDDCKDSDADASTGQTDCITLAEGETNLCVDAGIKPPVIYWGCTPGYWKTHPTIWDQASDLVSSCIAASTAGGNGTTSATVAETFGLTGAQLSAVGLSPTLTLLQAASSGGGGFKKLVRHGIPALLNSCGMSAHYPYSADQVVLAIHDAIVNMTPEPLASQFAAANEQDPNICPRADGTYTKMDRIAAEESGYPVPADAIKVIVFPNPANSIVNLNMIFRDAKERVVLEIFNVTGQKIAELYNASADANFEYHVEMNVSQLPSGAYFYRLNTGEETQMGKLSVVR